MILPNIDQAANRKPGLKYWAQQVLEESATVGDSLEPDSVHDLRVALRRCRSMADGFIRIDPHPKWKKLKKVGKALFSSLGGLRDAQVMAEWVNRLSGPDDPVRAVLLEFLMARQEKLKSAARDEIGRFDRKRWDALARACAKRAGAVPAGGLVFQHLAVERWEKAYGLHRRALRNRSQASFHALRIGLKKFRYTVENFLPRHHEKWGADLKELQDLLGEIHDLDVLTKTINGRPGLDRDARLRWRMKIREERRQRLETYRHRMVGPRSLWRVWRAALPEYDRPELHTP